MQPHETSLGPRPAGLPSALAQSLGNLYLPRLMAEVVDKGIVTGDTRSIILDGGRMLLMALATAFAYWCLPQLFFYGLYSMLGEVLKGRPRDSFAIATKALNIDGNASPERRACQAIDARCLCGSRCRFSRR